MEVHYEDGRQRPEYNAWCNMKARCYNQNNPKYSDYGGRGITVCACWIEDFEQFYRDLGPRPSANYSINRIDNNGNYESGNCEWALATDQANNRRLRNDNKSGVKGVTQHVRSGKWIAACTIKGRKVQLYRGSSLEAAIEARQEWELTNAP